MGLRRGLPPPQNKNSNSNYIILFYPLPRPLPCGNHRRKGSGEEASSLPGIKILILSPPQTSPHVVLAC